MRSLTRFPFSRRGSRAAPLLVGLAVLGTCVVATSPAHAQGASGSALAEALFDEGKKLLDEGKFVPACAKFEASQKLDPGLGTLLYLGECYERAGKFASSWARFREAASLANSQGDAREKVANERADALEPKIYKLTVTVAKPAPGLAVTLDGEPIAPATWGLGLPTDGGSHTLVATADGFTEWKLAFELPKTAGAQTIAVPELTEAPKTAPEITPSNVIEKVPPSTPPKQEEPGQGLLIGGIVVGSLGVATLAVTGALIGVASSKYGDADEFCTESICSDQQGVDLSDDARTLGNAATGTFIGGLVLVGAGLTMILLQPSSPSSTATAWTITSGPGDVGAGIRGTF